MNLPVHAQLIQFLWSVPFGFGLAVFWCLLRAIRTARPRLTHLCDGLFGLVLLPALLLFALYIGAGRFRLFFFPGIALGCILCFLPFGAGLHRIFRAFFHGLAVLLRFPLKIYRNFVKKLFSFTKK